MMDGINAPWIATGYDQWHWAPNTRVFMVPWSAFHPANRAQSHTQFIAALSAPPTARAAKNAAAGWPTSCATRCCAPSNRC